MFIDASKTSLKVVLLTNGKVSPLVPVAYSVDMKETNEHISRNLDKISYHDYNWKLCADLKVVVLLAGLQSGYTKYCRSYANGTAELETNITSYETGLCEVLRPVKKNVGHDPLVSTENIYLSPLHIKLESNRQDRRCISIFEKLNFLVLVRVKSRKDFS